jgi:hypothetical protein
MRFFHIQSSGRSKGEVHPITDHESPEVEWMYSPTLSLISALGGVRDQRLTPVTLTRERHDTH